MVWVRALRPLEISPPTWGAGKYGDSFSAGRAVGDKGTQLDSLNLGAPGAGLIKCASSDAICRKRIIDARVSQRPPRCCLVRVHERATLVQYFGAPSRLSRPEGASRPFYLLAQFWERHTVRLKIHVPTSYTLGVYLRKCYAVAETTYFCRRRGLWNPGPCQPKLTNLVRRGLLRRLSQWVGKIAPRRTLSGPPFWTNPRFQTTLKLLPITGYASMATLLAYKENCHGRIGSQEAQSVRRGVHSILWSGRG